MGIGSTIGSMIPTQGMQSAVQQSQSAPQPMGGKGGGLGTNPYAQSPSQPPQPMGGKGGMAAEPGVLRPYQPSMPRFTEMRPDSNQPTSAGMIYQGPYVDNSFLRAQREARMAPLQNQAQQPLFDANTTQAEFDRARGITPSVQPTQPGQAAQPASGAEEAFRRDFMNQYNQRQTMQQPRFMGGKGGGRFNPYAGGGYNPFGGYGGPEYGNRPFYGQEYGPSPGLGGLAALMQGRGMFFNEGGEVK